MTGPLQGTFVSYTHWFLHAAETHRQFFYTQRSTWAVYAQTESLPLVMHTFFGLYINTSLNTQSQILALVYDILW